MQLFDLHAILRLSVFTGLDGASSSARQAVSV